MSASAITAGRLVNQWQPLEAFCADPAKFMFMGMAEYADPEQGGDIVDVYLYKHINTRSYLNLDACGNAYRYDSISETYEPRHTFEAVLDCAL